VIFRVHAEKLDLQGLKVEREKRVVMVSREEKDTEV
jgi:hypothetical protein